MNLLDADEEAGGRHWVAGLVEQGDSSRGEAAEVTGGLTERARGRLLEQMVTWMGRPRAIPAALSLH